MASYNVNRCVVDTFYRYKMPGLIVKIEGKGNGIKTVIVNMNDIAIALARPTLYCCKYLGWELSVQTNFDTKSGFYIVNGIHHTEKLQDLLDGFIRNFVLCRVCDNPETKLIVSATKRVVLLYCLACGFKTNVDACQKLTNFILKNELKPEPYAAGVRRDKKGKKASKVKTSKVNKDDKNNHTIWTEITTKFDVISDGGDDWLNDWGDDASTENELMRHLELSDPVKDLVVNDETLRQCANLFYTEVKNLKEKQDLKGKENILLNQATRMRLKEKAPLILAELLFTEQIVVEVKEHCLLFRTFTDDNSKAQCNLLGALEIILGREYREQLLDKCADVLNVFFTLGILDKNIIIQWYKKISKKHVSKEVAIEVRHKAQPFVTRLLEESHENYKNHVPENAIGDSLAESRGNE